VELYLHFRYLVKHRDNFTFPSYQKTKNNARDTRLKFNNNFVLILIVRRIFIISPLKVEAPWTHPPKSPCSPSSGEVKECVELYLHSPTRLHGVVLS
jgi:hypothetical protein